VPCGDHTYCNRFKIYKEFGGENIPPGFDPSDTEEVKKHTVSAKEAGA